MKLQLLQCNEHTCTRIVDSTPRLDSSPTLFVPLFALFLRGIASHENKTLRQRQPTIANLKKLAYRSDTRGTNVLYYVRVRTRMLAIALLLVVARLLSWISSLLGRRPVRLQQ